MDEFCWQHDRYAVAKISESRVWDQVPEGSTLFSEVPKFPCNTVQERWKEAPMLKNRLICSAVLIEHWLVTDRQTDRHRLEAIANNHASIALNGEKLPIITLTECLVSTCTMPSSGWEDTNPVISIYLYDDIVRLWRKTLIQWLVSTCMTTSSGCEERH